MTSFVAYYRVSTLKQGQSGLGLEAQKEVVRSHIDRRGETIAAEFIGRQSFTTFPQLRLSNVPDGGTTPIRQKNNLVFRSTRNPL